MSWDEAKDSILKYLAAGGMVILLWQINDLKTTLKQILGQLVSHEIRLSRLEKGKRR